MQDNDIEYYRGRERHELILADAARDPAIATIHREMATHYRTLIDGFENRGGSLPSGSPRLHIIV